MFTFNIINIKKSCHYDGKRCFDHPEEAKNEKNWVNSYYFISQLSDKIHGHTNVVTDMGLSFVGTHQTIKTKIGQNIFTNSEPKFPSPPVISIFFIF